MDMFLDVDGIEYRVYWDTAVDMARQDRHKSSRLVVALREDTTVVADQPINFMYIIVDGREVVAKTNTLYFIQNGKIIFEKEYRELGIDTSQLVFSKEWNSYLQPILEKLIRENVTPQAPKIEEKQR